MPDPARGVSANRAGDVGPPRLNFPLHFVLLELVALLYLQVVLPRHLRLQSIPYGVEGALHALALALALRPIRPVRAVLFVVCTAVLACGAFIAGIWGGNGIARLLGHGYQFGSRAGFMLAICTAAALGALAYGCLIRLLWLPRLSAWSAPLIAIACAALVFLVMLARESAPDGYIPWVPVVWWFVFSGSLWVFCRLRPGPDGPLSEPRG